VNELEYADAFEVVYDVLQSPGIVAAAHCFRLLSQARPGSAPELTGAVPDLVGLVEVS